MIASSYRCGCPVSSPQHGAPRLANAIDLHCHILAPEAEALVAGRPEMQAMAQDLVRFNGEASQRHNMAMAPSYAPRLLDIPTRLADMDALGVAIQALSPSPTQYHYWADAALAYELVRVQNERLETICGSNPSRFVAFAAVALQHPELAATQLRAAMAKGFKGAEISTRVLDRDLSHPSFEPFWAAAVETGAVIFIHPLGTSLGERLNEHYLVNVIGQPLETTIALSKLIFSGVLDRHPGLKIVAAHGGGYLPQYFGRSDHAYAVRPESKGCSQRPSSYLSKIWFDTVVHDPTILQNLIAVAGVSQVVVGTDYPFDMGEYRLADLLDALPDLSVSDREAIVFRNAQQLLGLVEIAGASASPGLQPPPA